MLVFLLPGGFDQNLLGLPELLLHAGHDRAVLPENGSAAEHITGEPEKTCRRMFLNIKSKKRRGNLHRVKLRHKPIAVHRLDKCGSDLQMG